MKICMVMAGDEEGGLENHFVDLCNGLAGSGLEVVAIAHPKYRARLHPPVHYIAIDLTRNRRNPRQLLQLARILRREHPNIVHAQANKATAILTYLVPLVPGLKVATVHNRKHSTRMFTRMDALIGVSRGVIANIAHPNAQVIYNGMPPFTAQRMKRSDLTATFGLDSQQSVTLAVGRLVPAKAFDNLVNAWNPAFGQLLIVGDGPERDMLTGLVRELGLQHCVTLAGYRTDARSMMYGADLFVVASHREGFSYALAEALLARLPVLSTRVPGAEEIVPPQYLVPADDVAALQLALQRTLGDLPAARAGQAQLFDWAQANLHVAAMVQKTHDLYREILQLDRHG